jgi:eukaryotic-like serine/threonine-protein kinase
MSESQVCPECGSELPQDAPRGLCPRCLMKAVVAETRTTFEFGSSDADDDQATFIPSATENILVATRYRKLRDHAMGGLGVVYVARDEELRREVALKEIQDRHADDAGKRARFLIEAQITGELEHPGIIPVYCLGAHDDGRPFYAMRFIKGDTLTASILSFHADEALKNDPGTRSLALQKLLRRFMDVCNAIAYAHSRGVIHRDLKPDNVMVGSFGETLVVDWGLAKALNRSGSDGDEPRTASAVHSTSSNGLAGTLPGSVIGTPGYMSPEQASGNLDLLGPSSDVYSLGATLYTLLTGRAAFAGDDVRAVVRKVELGEFPRPRESSPWLDPALEAICLKAMSLHPDDRYASPQALADDLECWLADEPVAAYAEPLHRRVRRWARKRRTILATAGAAATVAALLLGVAVWFRIDQRRKTDSVALFTMEQANGMAIEARTSGDLARWDKAIAEALRAKERLESGGGSLALHHDVEVRLETFRSEQSRRRLALDADNKDRDMVTALEEARLQETNLRDERFDYEAKLDAYLAAFRAYGIDLATLDFKDASTRIRSSKVADDLITALDDCVLYPSIRIPTDRLKALARSAETDQVRAAIRDAIARNDVAGLLHMVERFEDRERLGSRLRTIFKALVRLDRAASLPLLETIRGEHASDFWINHELGWAYLKAKSPQAQEAVRCLSVAVALRPNSPGAVLNLGVALREQGKLESAIESFRNAIRIKPDYAEAHNNLGAALVALGKLDQAVESFRRVIQIKPDHAEAHYNLGIVLKDQGKLEAAIESYRNAIRIKPDYAEAHNNLGTALRGQRKLEQAIESYRKAMRIKPDDAVSHLNLGIALRDQQKFDQAEESYRRAIAIKADYAEAHNGLGVALRDQRKFDQAAESFLKAIEIQVDYAEAHNNLGAVLKAMGKLDQAAESFRKAIQIKPDLAEAHYNLGIVLQAQRKLKEAIEAYRNAILFKPDYAEAHNNLGFTLQAQGKLEPAIESYRKAIQFKPGYAMAHYNLAYILSDQGKLEEAIASYRKAIQFKPDYAVAYCNLGLLLGKMGRFGESLELLERGHSLGSRQPGWNEPSQDWVRKLRRYVELDTNLPAILKGEAKPTDAAERIELSRVCYYKGLHAASARFAGEAFAQNPELADNVKAGSRYNAACSASLAGSGQSKDEPMPDEAARAKLREQAVAWLRADLEIWTKTLEGGNEPARKQLVAKNLARWKEDTDLAGIRDEAALAKLREGEREGLRALWANVEALRRKAEGVGP